MLAGYWIEVVSRDPGAFSDDYPYNLAQTMLRVKDPAKSLGFYRDLLGMHLLAVKHFSDFSLYFLTQVVVAAGGGAHPHDAALPACLPACGDGHAGGGGGVCSTPPRTRRRTPSRRRPTACSRPCTTPVGR